jgi:hypothetical protein
VPRQSHRSPNTLWVIFRKALALRPNFYEDAYKLPQARRRAFLIVVLAAISHGLGGTVILLFSRAPTGFLLLAFVINASIIVGGYYFWTFTIFKLGQRFKGKVPQYKNLLSPVGFAYAPQVLNILTLIPLLGRPIQLVLAIWSWLTVTIATREAFSISTPPAALMGFVGWMIIQIAIGLLQVLEQHWIQLFH